MAEPLPDHNELTPGTLVEIQEPTVLRHGIVVGRQRDDGWAVLLIPASERDGYAREGVQCHFPAAETVRPRRRKGPWDDLLGAAYESDPWDLRPYADSPRRARYEAQRKGEVPGKRTTQ